MKLLDPIVHSCLPRTKAYLVEVGQVADRTTLKRIQDSSSCKTNDSEHLLRLSAFDPTNDTPIELLHTLPLGIAKFMVVFLWKNVLSSTSDKNRLQAAFTKYHSCKAYSRTFRSLMRYNGSIVGRDFKKLV
ncbi:hypothetical protein BD408DRAFT_407457 [Parasitella parasitica]|nr:hypothetical protein BD408DRAFT_407457 [Parasitella parasitica]